MTVILDKIPADVNGYYAGGALAFGADDSLYVTVGIGSRPQDSQNASSVLGKVLRINSDGTIPPDNPFPGSPVYTLGHRNNYGIAFDKNSGLGIVTENGDTRYDEVNLIKKGGNYGFPTIQHSTLSSIINPDFISPIREYETVIAPTQTIFYEGSKFPELHEKFVIESYNDGNLRAFRIYENQTGKGVDELLVQLHLEELDNIISIATIAARGYMTMADSTCTSWNPLRLEIILLCAPLQSI